MGYDKRKRFTCLQQLMHVLDERSRQVLYHLVDTYLETRAPVGSLTLAKRLGMRLSPATVRNVMADLEALSLVASPHTSAGRLPTEHGLKLVVNTLLELGDLQPLDKEHLEQSCQKSSQNLDHLFEEATTTLSGLSSCAGVIAAPKEEAALKHVEFVFLKPGRALVILVTTSGGVENRLMEIPKSVMPFHLETATNYMNAHLHGKTLEELKQQVQRAFQSDQAMLDAVSQQLINKGLAVWSDEDTKGNLIIKGQANLLKTATDTKELEDLQQLITALDTKEGLLGLLDHAIEAEGIQIFIGAENVLFQSNKCAAVIAPYKSGSGVLGAVGVVGPTYMNYRRVIPMVDYTARLLGRILES